MILAKSRLCAMNHHSHARTLRPAAVQWLADDTRAAPRNRGRIAPVVSPRKLTILASGNAPTTGQVHCDDRGRSVNAIWSGGDMRAADTCHAESDYD